jgi:hypothetical protein
MGSFIEPLVSASAAPNRVRVGSGNSGTLSIRRRWTNNTGQTVTRLRFRTVDITTLNSPGYTNAAQADLRTTDSTDVVGVVTSLGTLTVKGTTVETPPVLGVGGGGANSSYTVVLPGGGIAPGASIDTQFLVNVVRLGVFRVLVTVEVLP